MYVHTNRLVITFLPLMLAGCPVERPEETLEDPGHDWDGDGYCETAPCLDDLEGGDCNDDDPTIHPGADEGCDGLDTDCDGSLGSAEVDGDGDGHLVCQGDCNDEDPDVHPGADEQCNGIDDDCDGAPDANEVDSDGDLYMACEGDCDDGNADIYPGADEVCNGIDDDCDGAPDADEVDSDGDLYMACEGDCDDGDADVSPAAEEICQDGTDNDCNGIADDCCMAVEFDGNDYISVEHSTELNLSAGSFTVEAWAYLDAYSIHNASPIVGKMSLDTGLSHGWILWITGEANGPGYPPGTPVFSIWQSDGQGQGVVGDGTVVPSETWFHLAATYDVNTSTTTLWLDGVFVTSDTGLPPPASNHVSLLVGMYRPDCGGVCRYWDGVIDEVRLSSEVRYTADFSPDIHFQPDADTIALWHFNEGVGETCFDDSGNGLDGTSYGATWVEDCP